MPRAEEPVYDELPERLVMERKALEAFHKETVEEPFHEFIVTFPLQSAHLIGIETFEVAAERYSGLSDKEKKKAWCKAPKTKFSYTALHEVVRSGDLKALREITENYPVDLNSQSRSGRTALHYAILMGHDEMIGFLLTRNVDVSIVDKVGCNALHLAVALNRESLAKALLSLGLDFQQKNNAGHRPLEIIALNVLGYKNTNLYKHLIKLIIKKQTGIVEKWLKDLYSCGIFEMTMSPRELTGSQLLDLQSVNAALFLEQWKALQLVMDPDFKSTGRSTLPGQGFRDDRPSSLANGRFFELWSKYYDSLKLGCKPELICKFSKKTEPDTVHLKYEIRGIRKGRYDPGFIDMGMMVVSLKNDLILKEDVDPDISVEQPEIVKPTSSGGFQKPKKQKKMHQKANGDVQEENSDTSDGDDELEVLCIIEQEIQAMIEIIDVVHLMSNFVITSIALDSTSVRHQLSAIDEGAFFSNLSISLAVAAVIDTLITDVERDMKATRQPTPTTLESILQEFENGGAQAISAQFLREGPIVHPKTMRQLLISSDSPIDVGAFPVNLSISLAVAAVIDTLITDVERDMKATRQPTPTTLESILQEFENGGVRAKTSRFLRDGPIIDLRSLPWEVQASECAQSTLTPSKYQVCQVSFHAADVRSDLRGQPTNVASSAFDGNSVQNVICNSAVEVPMLNFAKSFATRDQHAW